ncbi:tetratricopeptide repeat protein [uncultured Polaribacter sp.]|uniref:tetratricopeptide repeat protein n=1 Tax=uncultured Polaribacter sp. TaxID=174711 RepID=UPI002612F7F7|nr:tetratricopeptide repeat protein [uncultured Polaribacter sp.]
MKKITLILISLFTIWSCENDGISDKDKKKAIELNNQAVDLRINGKMEEAKKIYEKALKIDGTNLNIRFALIGIYGEEKETEKAFELLEKLPEKQKGTVYYYQAKAGIFELNGDIENAKINYVNAYNLSEIGEIKNEKDLNSLVGYAMIETFSGQKERAVERINKVLKFDWLTENNKEYLETFRNEFEFYQGNGALEFENKTEIRICTKNTDSLKTLLRNNHINISGGSNPIGKNKLSELRINSKFRSAIEKLGIKECEKNVP